MRVPIGQYLKEIRSEEAVERIPGRVHDPTHQKRLARLVGIYGAEELEE
jgi:hypothetical protein